MNFVNMKSIANNKLINSSQPLTHIAVVMDGNGRWQSAGVMLETV